MATDKMEWVEIIEPKTKEHMYANLTTGECVWDPPTGVPVKKTDNKQWWELFDHNTGRFYYYNATSQKTVWHRPVNCDIIPLAKLQTLKQNTEPANTDDGTPNNDVSSTTSSHKSKESVATQTPGGGAGGRSSIRHTQPTSNVKINNCMNSSCKTGTNGSGGGGQDTGQNSPRSSRLHHHHHHHRHGHQDSCRTGDGRGRRGSQGSWRRNTHTQDSGRSSDSSSVSLCRHQSASAAVGTTTSTATTTTTIGTSGDCLQLQQHHLTARAGVGTASDSVSSAANKPSLAPSPSTPLLKKRSPSQSIKANSFDINISVGGGYSLGQENRSGGRPPQRILTGSSSNHGIARSHSFAQKQSQAPPAATPGGTQAGNVTNITHHPAQQQHNDDEEDSMHEKYFMSGRRSADSPMDKDISKNISLSKLSPDYANFSTLPQKISQDTSTRHTREASSDLDEMNGMNLTGAWCATASLNRKNDNSSDTGSRRLEQGGGGLDNRSSGGSCGGNSGGGNTTDSWAVAAATQLQPHILPLHHYILEQAKLSGCYKFGGLPEETDSLNSDDDEGGEAGVGRLDIGAGAGGGGAGGRRVHHHRSHRSRGGTATATLMDYDSDEFADDEAVQDDDSSSQECCLEEDDDVDDDDDEDDPPYINTNVSRFSDHHYSDAADYTDTLQAGSDIASSLYCNTRMSQHTVRPTNPPNTTTPPATGWSYKREGVIPLETQHTSLKRIREPVPPQPPPLYSPILERSEFGRNRHHYYHRQHSVDYPHHLHHTNDHHHLRRQDQKQEQHHRTSPLMAQSLPSSPSPMSASYDSEKLSRLGLNRERKLPSESDIEKYAQDNLNIHKKGIFRKKFSVRELLSWSKDPIRKPMLVLSDKNLKKEATEVFRMVQTYMGDRKGKQGATQESVLLEMTTLAHANPALRDELFIQICRQTTENPRRDSLIKGWELMAICLYFFPPSPKFQAYLESYMNRHRDPSYEHFPEVGKWPIHVQVSHYASVACKRLQRIGAGGKRPIRKPNLEEIEQAKIQIFRPSMFGSTLEEVMEMQKSRFPHYKLPWVQTTLSDQVLKLQGTHTEGIFRVSADVDEVTSLKQQLDRWDKPTEYTDAHTPASLLKLWYRELYEPLIPDSLYEECIQQCDDAEQAAAIVDTLPHLNKMVLAYLIRFLQIFARPEVVAVTKMDASNLAMVMAPNCLRCCCQEPRVMYENARKEMAFIRTLILSMDTGFMQGVL